ncbi:uncharacterized protein C8Q71DRAFT_791547 [Rhodofomes roseus]|uniref:G domain-containing protein n=1 Tax=Rhodofomes roseus TaxID=34475 RepID=A0ABQ8JZI9_9APHY|nr:uncharacterized protein C8Q71DRAFT_791547 [Rhodofomes roseus]KAH9829185.1 hypothetical protein C8Q71DRAFT_791547 [Rhodofomes roseus]
MTSPTVEELSHTDAMDTERDEPTPVVDERRALGNGGKPSARQSSHLVDEASQGPDADGSYPGGNGIVSSVYPSESLLHIGELREGKEHILVIGKTGSGKTTFINLAANANLPVGEEHVQEQCTTAIQSAEFNDATPVMLYDVPDVVEIPGVRTQVAPLDTDKQPAWAAVVYVIDSTDRRAELFKEENYQILDELDKRCKLRRLLFLVSRWPSQEDQGRLTEALGRRSEYERFIEKYLERGAIVREFNREMGSEGARAAVQDLLKTRLAETGTDCPNSLCVRP